jgi:uncharacterized protein YaaN involved in tellurite resistance
MKQKKSFSEKMDALIHELKQKLYQVPVSVQISPVGEDSLTELFRKDLVSCEQSFFGIGESYNKILDFYHKKIIRAYKKAVADHDDDKTLLLAQEKRILKQWELLRDETFKILDKLFEDSVDMIKRHYQNYQVTVVDPKIRIINLPEYAKRLLEVMIVQRSRANQRSPGYFKMFASVEHTPIELYKKIEKLSA